MGRKKDQNVSKAEPSLQVKPFCYYCDKEFENDKLLVTHQRTKHFKCLECGQQFDTVTGLRVHMLNAYKKTMKEVPNAIPGRENPDIVVHGMEGLPKGILETKMQAAMAEYNASMKAREEDRERQRVRVAEERKEAGLEAEEPQAPVEREPPPPPPGSAPPPVPGSSRPESRTEAPPPPGMSYGQVPAPQPGGLLSPSLAQASMAGLSPAVAKLLQPGGRTDSDFKAGQPVAVPGVPGLLAPKALAGLHPIALQCLGVAGMLLPMTGGEPDAKRMRLTSSW